MEDSTAFSHLADSDEGGKERFKNIHFSQEIRPITKQYNKHFMKIYLRDLVPLKQVHLQLTIYIFTNLQPDGQVRI
eukprot:c18012_g1_i5 orf=209-436(-)